MRNILLAFMLFFFNGCAINQLFLSEEIDNVTVVKYQTYLKQHRAYFKRDTLKLVTKHDKYLFLYHTEKHELALLLHRQDTYKLYNFTKPDEPNITLTVQKKIRYKHLLTHFSGLGYKPVNLGDVGYTAKIALRKYKGVKTLMVETKDYSTLKQKYEKAIRTYDATNVMSIKTHLPKNLIYPYFENYKAKATTPEQLTQLQKVANKLRFQDEESVMPDEELEKVIFTSSKGYDYYLYRAPVNELERYLGKSKTKAALSQPEYKVLNTHLADIQEEELLSEGTLEELISKYKVNKDPKYKKRIMTLMKETQAQL